MKVQKHNFEIGVKAMPTQYSEKLKLFMLDTVNTTYAMEVNEANNLIHLYWGGKVSSPEDLPKGETLQYYPFEARDRKLRANEEYAGWGGYFFDEPSLKVTFSDYVRDLALKYEGYRVERGEGTEKLVVTLKDEYYPFKVHLQYKIYHGLDIIDRNCILENAGKKPVTVESAQSARWHVPRGKNYRLTHMSGKWGGEYQLERIKLTQSKVVLEGRRGVSGPDNNPWYALDFGGIADEVQGRVWFGALQWSGNWKIVAEVNRYEQTRVTGGINDFDFSWNLKGGEKFTTPVFTGGYTDKGFGEASRILHRYQRKFLVPKSKAYKLRPIMWNSWVYRFDINEKKLMEAAERCAKIGVELFVVDDGWFSTRDNDRSGLGDWYPSKTKFPNGLKPLIDKVNSLGMDFGIWVEPEMVNPDSELYRKHPDWVLHFPTRKRTTSRNQLVLNFAREDVKEFAYDFVDRLLSEHNIKYLKWDMNRYFSEPGWPSVPPEEQRSVWVGYVLNLYDVFERLQKKFPDVFFENCSSGGARMDLGMARITDMANPSDNWDSLDVLKMYEGYTQVYLPNGYDTGFGVVSGPGGVNRRYVPMRYMAHVAMLGACFTGGDILKATEEELEKMKRYVEFFKDIRPVVQNGDLYRLASAYSNPYMAVNFVSQDKSRVVLFVLGQFIQFRRPMPRIRPQGLDPNKVYHVEGYKPMFGKDLMEIGVEVDLVGDYDSKVIRINEVK